jgi:toxin-antitoxin system PIN domain toxin
MKKGSSNLLFPDVNVLIGLAWPNHQFHSVAIRTIAASTDRWATCALTQLGFIRLSSNPAVNPAAKSPSEAASLLEAMTGDALHVYLDTPPSPVDSRREFEKVLGHKQVTDAYLLALARHYNATFITFDTKLKVLAGQETRIQVLGGG